MKEREKWAEFVRELLDLRDGLLHVDILSQNEVLELIQIACTLWSTLINVYWLYLLLFPYLFFLSTKQACMTNSTSLCTPFNVPSFNVNGLGQDPKRI